MDIASFKAENFLKLEKKAAEIPWFLFLTTNHQSPTTIHVTCKHSRLYHSDAVAERFYNIFNGGSLPLVRTASLSTPSAGTPRNAPPQDKPSSQNIFVTLIDDRCTVSLDLAGEELYKRGYQRFVNDAPLKETIAAAMLFEAIHCSKGEARPHSSKPDMSGDHTTLIDPMAGSGTFSLEAAYMTNGIIPGMCRDFALKHQPAFKEASWNYIIRRKTKDVARQPRRKNDDSELSLRGYDARDCHERSVVVAITSPIHKIITSDISEQAVEIIRHNVESSPLAKIESAPIVPQKKDFFSYTPEEISNIGHDTSNGSRNARVIIVLNPPYGKRLDADAPKLYARIGKKLSELAQGIGRPLVVAILAPKGACTDNLLKNCPALATPDTKQIKTSHGGISLNCFVRKIF